MNNNKNKLNSKKNGIFQLIPNTTLVVKIHRKWMEGLCWKKKK